MELELDKKENIFCQITEEFYMRSTNSGDEDELEMFSQDHNGMFPSLHIPTVCQKAADDFCNLELEDVVELLILVLSPTKCKNCFQQFNVVKFYLDINVREAVAVC